MYHLSLCPNNKKMMNRIVTGLIGFLMVTGVCFGQNDPAAKKILDAVGAKVRASKGISAVCVLSSYTSKGKPNGKQSLSLFMKGEKYFLKQGKSEIICDGRDIYRFDGDKTITKAAVEEGGQTLSPQKLLAGAYDKDFTYKLLSTKGANYEIEMIPIDNRKNFQKVNLYINKSRNEFARARITDKSYNITELSLSNINFQAKVDDSKVAFDKKRYPSDVEILD